MAKAKIGELLVEAKVITQSQLDEALALPRDGQKLGQLLVERGYLGEAALTQALSQQLSVPWVALAHVDFSRQLLNLVPQELAERCTVVPVFVRTEKRQGVTLYVAMDDPTNETALAEVAEATRLPTRAMIASRSEILAAIRVYYRGEPAGALPPITNQPRADEATPTETPAVRIDESADESYAPPTAPRVLEIDVDEPARGPETVRDPLLGPPSSRKPRMVAMTLLDGTTIQLPTQRKSTHPDTSGEPSLSADLTTGDLVAALRAMAEGKDVGALLGKDVKWELLMAALLSVLVRKGQIADWEFVDELRKLSSQRSPHSK